MPKGPCNHGAEMLEALDQPEKTTVPDLENLKDVVQEAHNRFESKETFTSIFREINPFLLMLFGFFLGIILTTI